MKVQTVVTNVRMPKDEWIQIKIAAAEAEMSANEYVHYAIRAFATHKQLFGTPRKTPEKYSAMRGVLRRKTKRNPMGWSDEDKAIYSV